MKSWSELTEAEKQAVLKLSLELSKIFDAIVDELVPVFEYITDILVAEVKRQEDIKAKIRKAGIPDALLYIDGVDLDD